MHIETNHSRCLRGSIAQAAALAFWVALLSDAVRAASASGSAWPPGETAFVVYALSRGKGVPQSTRAVLQSLHASFERQRLAGKVNRLILERIGIEGELRLCVDFESPEAARLAWSEARDTVSNTELIGLKYGVCDGS